MKLLTKEYLRNFNVYKSWSILERNKDYFDKYVRIHISIKFSKIYLTRTFYPVGHTIKLIEDALSN